MDSTGCLAIDLGASSGRVMLGIVSGAGNQSSIELEEVHRFPNVPRDQGGHLCWNFEALWQAIQSGLSNGAFIARQRLLTLGSIGIDTWGVDFGLLEGDALAEPPVHYRDQRTLGVLEDVVSRIIPREELFAETGIQFLPFNTIFQLVALQREAPDKLKRASVLLMIPDLIHHRLTGKKVTEYTNASTTQLLDPHARTWNNRLLTRLGFPQNIFPEIVEPGTSLGLIAPHLSAQHMLPPKVEVIAVATHDTGSAVAAVPTTEGPGQFAYLSCGTWSLLGTEVSAPVVSAAALARNFTNEGGVGGTIRLLKNIMGLWILQECRSQWQREGSTIDWDEMIASAQPLAESDDGLKYLIDPDDGRFLPPGDMPGRIGAFCQERGMAAPDSVPAMICCVLASLALKYAVVLQELEELVGHSIPVLHMVGGGIQNRLLCQWAANAIGRPVIAGPVEATALGNAAVQLMARGVFRDMAEARACIKRSFPPSVFVPDPKTRDAWSDAAVRFAALRHGGVA